jgi:hypothetical protein
LSVTVDVAYQPDLFGGGEASFDAKFSDVRRIALDDDTWIDLAPGWIEAADWLFEHVLSRASWAQRSRWMYDRRVTEPRLTAQWTLGSGEALEPPILERMRLALSARYGVVFDSAGFNLLGLGEKAFDPFALGHRVVMAKL